MNLARLIAALKPLIEAFIDETQTDERRAQAAAEVIGLLITATDVLPPAKAEYERDNP